MISFSYMNIAASVFIFLTCNNLSSAEPLPLPTILADTNRDGVVNDADLAQKQLWTRSRGAIFLANIGDSQKRCPVADLAGNPLSNDELAACHDASGHMLLAPEYAAPLQITPMPQISENATGRIYATPASAYDRVRIFVNDNPSSTNHSRWRITDRDFVFNLTQLEQGISLGIDAREPIMNTSIWDGVANIVFEVIDGPNIAADSVAIRVAPIITHTHLQNVDSVYATAGNETKSWWQAHFVKGVADALQQGSPSSTPLQLFNGSDDIWAQDFFEPGYTSMPGKDGPISLRVMIRSAQSTRTAGRQVFEQMLGPGMGAIQLKPGYGHVEINSGGNIETIPPYTSKSGVHYPQGRIIMGKHFNELPASSILTFLQSQEIQNPLILETGWLVVGHVDEMFQFLPTDTPLGFKIAVANTTAALDLLRNAQASGHGSIKVSSYNGSTEVEPTALSFYEYEEKRYDMTLDELLADQEFLEDNAYGQKYINENRLLLEQEIELTDDDFIQVPVLFNNFAVEWPHTSDNLPDRITQPLPGEGKLKSVYPETINGLVLKGHHIAPKPWGPVVNGRDILEDEIVKLYGSIGMNVSFVDDFMSHHVRGGEVHCGTNSLRQTDQPWWV